MDSIQYQMCVQRLLNQMKHQEQLYNNLNQTKTPPSISGIIISVILILIALYLTNKLINITMIPTHKLEEKKKAKKESN